MANQIVKVEQQTKALLKENQRSIAALLPPQMPAAKFMRTVVNALVKTPSLASANRDSLLLAVLNAAGTGLEVDGREGALVPYKGQVQFQPMYQGLVKLARQSGEVVSIHAAVVRKGDEFKYSLGLRPELDHVPTTDSKYGDWTHVYAVAHLRDGGYQFEVMSKLDVMRIKAKSPAASSSSSPWKTDEEAMAIKTVIKRLCKLLPQSTELSRAIALDNASDMGQRQAAEFDLDDVQINVPTEDAQPEPEQEPTEQPADKGKGGLV